MGAFGTSGKGGSFFGGGRDKNMSGGRGGGAHRGKPAKGKGGVGKPLKGSRHKGGAKGGLDRWG